MKKLFQKIKNIGQDKELKFWHRVVCYSIFIGLGLGAAKFTPYIMWMLYDIPKEKIEIQAYIFVFGFVVSLGVGYIRIRDKRWEFATNFNQQRWTRLSNAASLLLTKEATAQAKRAGLMELIQLKREDFQTSYINRITSSGLDLKNINLSGVDLSGSNLSGAYLTQANLIDANLSDANLYKVNLNKANLSGSNLEEAHLYQTDLRGVDLRNTDLGKVYLWDVNLRDANLRGANLRGARYNRGTIFPYGFNPKDHDMIKVI